MAYEDDYEEPAEKTGGKGMDDKSLCALIDQERANGVGIDD